MNSNRKASIERIVIDKKQKRIVNDLRIRQINRDRGEYDSKEHPRTKRKQPLSHNKRNSSKPEN